MKSRQGTLQKQIFLSVFAGVACLFFFACGIPVYYVIEPPVAENIPTVDTDDISKKYFSFICPYNNSSENSEFTLYGTDIYYKIYNSLDDMNTEISRINSRNSEYSSSGFETIRELNYQTLWLASGASPVVPKTTASRTVRLRLCSDVGYDPELYDVTNDTLISIPYRKGTGNTGSGNMSFDFTSNYYPVSTDSDTKIIEDIQNGGVWYVNLYAVTVGRDASLASQYSSLLFLGNIKIQQTQ